jgi:hypothetical protein
MTKINLEYVISAVGQMGVFTTHVYENHHDLLKANLHELMSDLKRSIASKVRNTNPTVATLFNAYTEANFSEKFGTLNNIGAAARYADSGGLQIVTVGKQITDAIKQQIYKTQTAADYAMCFDVIPLESFSVTRTRNERSNVGNKIFNNSKHAESGRLTGLNIKQQIKTFRELGAKTKVIPIIQGNNADDMILYFNQIAAQLSDEDYAFISGMAVADTCIGNGVLESIEMLKGAKEITKICHDNIKKHLHILGVGSVSRMRPILYLNKSGYLNTFEKVSYDSSSHTSTFDYGLLKVNGTCTALGSVRTPKAEAHFQNVYRLFNRFLSSKVTQGEFLDMILGDGKRDWKYSTVKDLANSFSEEKMMIAYLIKTIHTYYQIDNFVTCLDRVLEEQSSGIKEIDSLLQVSSDQEMASWFKHISRSVKSKRIKRKEDHGSLEGVFA